ncbi:hypothetical protein [Longispora urticae]
MSRQQFGFLVGFLTVAVWAVAGFGAAVAAVAVGAAGWFVGRVLDGQVDVADLVDRFGSHTKTR